MRGDRLNKSVSSVFQELPADNPATYAVRKLHQVGMILHLFLNAIDQPRQAAPALSSSDLLRGLREMKNRPLRAALPRASAGPICLARFDNTPNMKTLTQAPYSCNSEFRERLNLGSK